MKLSKYVLLLIVVYGCSNPTTPGSNIQSGLYGTWNDVKDSITLVLTDSNNATITFNGKNPQNDNGSRGTYAGSVKRPFTDSISNAPVWPPQILIVWQAPANGVGIAQWYCALTHVQDSLIGTIGQPGMGWNCKFIR